MQPLVVLAVIVAFFGFSSACNDIAERKTCAYYKGIGYCTQAAVDWMKKNCAKTCGHCTTGGGGGGGDGGGTGGEGGSGGGGSGSCGRSSVQQSRIISGSDAKPGAWPWMASLWMYRRSHICGGTLLNNRWILTASHCVSGTGASTSNLQIKLGEHYHKSNDGNEQVIAVEKIIPHPQYSRKRLTNDIALIKLRNPARINNRVQTICLPSSGSRPQVGSRQCYLAGWGSIQHPGGSHHTLQQAMLPVVSHSNCFNQKNFVCTGFGKSSLTNACRGDSGGPLMCRKSDGSWEQHGVASFVVEYCKYYTAFTPVGDYISWINQHINN